MTAFVDTNVLVYAASSDAKAARAQTVLQAGGVVSVQVLNEFVAVMRRKAGADWEDVETALSAFEALLGAPRPVTYATHQMAVVLARGHRLSIYDACIIAAALEAGCTTLWTEDMQHGLAFGGLLLRDPFRSE